VPEGSAEAKGEAKGEGEEAGVVYDRWLARGLPKPLTLKAAFLTTAAGVAALPLPATAPAPAPAPAPALVPAPEEEEEEEGWKETVTADTL
jgi:hypothetical protein